MIEALEERRDLVRDVVEEALEDMAMVRAIDEEAESSAVDPSEVYKILETKPVELLAAHRPSRACSDGL